MTRSASRRQARRMAAGADILVIGRAITGAADPAAAAQKILDELSHAVDVKICGLSTPEPIDAALDAGADLVGFVFYPRSPRHVSLRRRRTLPIMRGAGQKSWR